MNQEQHLLMLFRRLSSEGRTSLMSYAEYLAERTQAKGTRAGEGAPIPAERPENETVPQALKRLRATYSMLDASKLLAEASDLMSQYIIQGRPPAEVIDDLEDLFKRYYQNYLNGINE